MIYSYAGGSGAARNGQERPPITAAAVACSFSAGQYKGELAKKWIKFCKDNIPVAKGRVSHDEYQSYYFAQASTSSATTATARCSRRRTRARG